MQRLMTYDMQLRQIDQVLCVFSIAISAVVHYKRNILHQDVDFLADIALVTIAVVRAVLQLRLNDAERAKRQAGYCCNADEVTDGPSYYVILSSSFMAFMLYKRHATGTQQLQGF